MGAPSKVQVESYTDLIAAMMAANLQGRHAEQGLLATPVNGGGRTISSLFDLVDGSGDPAVEAALAASANAVDRHALPEQLYKAVEHLSTLSTYRAFATALSDLVKSDDGGDYADFRTYLADKTATIHPLAAELFRALLGAGHFLASSDVTTVFAPTYACVAPDRVYTGADGALAEDTTDAQDVGTADVALFASDNDCVYLGSRHKFSGVIFALSTLSSADVAWTPQYWNGNAWVSLAGVTDSSVGLTKNDRMKWTVPTDWQRWYKDSGGTAFTDLARLYYVRLQRTENTVVTPPVATCIRLIPQPTLLSATSSSHLGTPQPPLAICRITGVNTIAVEQVADVDYTRFIEPVPYLRALTPFSANLTPTLSYVDQDGNNATNAQSAWTAPAALAQVLATLAGGDTGVRSIRTTGWAVTTAAVEGVFEVAVVESRVPAL